MKKPRRAGPTPLALMLRLCRRKRRRHREARRSSTEIPMKMFTLAALASFVVGAPALAQYRPNYPCGAPGAYPGGSPAVSPYLNILGRGNNPAINYYGITRPQIELRNALYGGGGQFNAGPPEAEDMYDPQLRRGTGHTATFSNL